MTAARELAAWGLGLSLSDVPEAAQQAAKRHLLDGLGCALAAYRLGEAPFAVPVALGLGGPAEATLIGDATLVSAPAAALANGALVHGLDFDDTHQEALVHATAVVLPVALAVGEERDASGAEVLAAAIAGYELIARLGAAIAHGFHRRGFHATSVCGVFAAALIASKLYGLDRETTVNALGIAGSQASGSLEFLNTGSATKQIHPGWAAHAGILAARLAAAGATGPATILEGAHGLFRAYADAEVDPKTLVDGLGSRWEVTRITIKPYPVCQLSHASLDALASLLPLDGIERITFDVPTASVPIVCEPADTKRAPRTPYEGKFSLAFSAASLVVDGALNVASFEPAALTRDAVLAMARRVSYRAVEVSGAPADAPGRAEVTLGDGRVLIGEVAASRGGPANPLSDADVIEKFVSNAGSKDPVDTMLTLEDRPTVRGIL